MTLLLIAAGIVAVGWTLLAGVAFRGWFWQRKDDQHE